MSAAGFRKQLAVIGVAAGLPFPIHPHMPVPRTVLSGPIYGVTPSGDAGDGGCPLQRSIGPFPPPFPTLVPYGLPSGRSAHALLQALFLEASAGRC